MAMVGLMSLSWMQNVQVANNPDRPDDLIVLHKIENL